MYPISEVLYQDLYRAKIPGCNVIPIGSYHAFGFGKDKDYVIHIEWPVRLPAQPVSLDDPVHNAIEALKDQGYRVTSIALDPEEEGSGAGSDTFTAMRKDDLNLLVTSDRNFAERSKAAFHVVCALQLTRKEDRVRVHQIVVDGIYE